MNKIIIFPLPYVNILLFSCAECIQTFSDRDTKIYGVKEEGNDREHFTTRRLFMFETQIEDKVQYSQTPTVSVGIGYGGPGYYVGGSVPVAGGGLKAYYYKEGMLIINMYDTQTGHLIWTGGAKKSLTNSTDVEQVIKSAVKFIFIRLPIGHKAK